MNGVEGAAAPAPTILVGVTGSVAAVKLGSLVAELMRLGQVRIVSTGCAEHFWGSEAVALPAGVAVYRDRDEWSGWSGMGDQVLHIELRRWARVFVIAPLDANSLAKLASGLCDNLVTCVARCWNVAEGTLIVAPAMNSLMWTHPVTARHVAVLEEWGIRVVPPVSKRLACGDVGVGAMADVATIAAAVAEALQK